MEEVLMLVLLSNCTVIDIVPFPVIEVPLIPFTDQEMKAQRGYVSCHFLQLVCGQAGMANQAI